MYLIESLHSGQLGISLKVMRLTHCRKNVIIFNRKLWNNQITWLVRPICASSQWTQESLRHFHTWHIKWIRIAYKIVTNSLNFNIRQITQRKAYNKPPTEQPDEGKFTFQVGSAFAPACTCSMAFNASTCRLRKLLAVILKTLLQVMMTLQ